MRGISVSHKRTRAIQGRFEVNLLTVASLGGEASVEAGTEKQVGQDNPEYWIEELLKRAHKRFQLIFRTLRRQKTDFVVSSGVEDTYDRDDL